MYLINPKKWDIIFKGLFFQGFIGAVVVMFVWYWIYNYLCNQSLSTLTLWVRIPSRRGVLDTTLCDEVCQWLKIGQWFSTGTTVSSTNKTDCHDITEILLKVVLNTITSNQTKVYQSYIGKVIFFVYADSTLSCQPLLTVEILCVIRIQLRHKKMPGWLTWNEQC